MGTASAILDHGIPLGKILLCGSSLPGGIVGLGAGHLSFMALEAGPRPGLTGTPRNTAAGHTNSKPDVLTPAHVRYAQGSRLSRTNVRSTDGTDPPADKGTATGTFRGTSLPLRLRVSALHLMDIPHNLEEDIGSHSREDVPPPVELQPPSPRQPDPRPKLPKLSAQLEVDIPQQVPQQERRDGDPLRAAPRHDLPLGEPRREVEEVDAARKRQEHHARECREVVYDLARPDVEHRKRERDGHDGGGGEALLRGGLADGEDAAEHGGAEDDHGEVVDELQGLAEGGVEEEGADADEEDRGRHEVYAGREEAAAAGAVHVAEGEEDW